MTFNNSDDLNLGGTVKAEEMKLQYPIPNRPESPLGVVPIPISSTARQQAALMAELCRNTDRKQIMRRNLLATIAVHDYLKLQGYLPDLKASDCWNPILGRTGEVSDLMVSQVGRIECCAIEPGESNCAVPADGQFDRSGYVAVEMDTEERWGWLLGFIPGGNEVNAIETLKRKNLQSMDEFGDHLYQLSWLKDARIVIDLGRWFKESQNSEDELRSVMRNPGTQINGGWQHPETFFSYEELTPAFRTRNNFVKRGKLIRLETEVMQQNVVLVMNLESLSEQDTNIILEVLPPSGHRYLPKDLHVRVIDDQQKAVMEATASGTNQNIQFNFNVIAGEHFSTQLILGEASVTEEFVVGDSNE